MKEFELTLRVQNNRLKERRALLGMSQPKFCATAGISLTRYRGLETLRASPRDSAGNWRKIALELAAFHCVEPDALFPEAIFAIKTPVASVQLDATDLMLTLSEHHQRLLEAPDVIQERGELHEKVRYVLSQLTAKQAEILRLRFGLTKAGEAHTQADVAEAFGVTSVRIQQLEKQALRRLRHPFFAKHVRVFHHEDK